MNRQILTEGGRGCATLLTGATVDFTNTLNELTRFSTFQQDLLVLLY